MALLDTGVTHIARAMEQKNVALSEWVVCPYFIKALPLEGPTHIKIKDC